MNWNQALELASAKLPATLNARTDAICTAAAGQYDPVLGEIDTGGLTRARYAEYMHWLGQPGVPWNGSERAARLVLSPAEKQKAEAATARVRRVVETAIEAMHEMQPQAVPAPVATALSTPGSTLPGLGELTVVQDWVIDTGHGSVFTVAGTTQATTGPRPV